MNSSPRPVFCFHQDPKLLWNEVSGVSSYKFKLVNQENSQELWSMEVSNSQCKNGTCQCDYPEDKEFLEPLVSYLLTAKANDGESLKEYQTEVILLEEEAQKAF